MLRMLKILAVLSSLAVAATASAAADAKSDAAAQKKKAPAKKPTFESSATATATATVDSVDMKKRTLTYHTPDGGLETIEVGKAVKNLGKVKPGDLVTVTYHEYTRLAVYPADAVLPDDVAAVEEARSKEGEEPAGVAGAHVTLKATVEKIDKKTGAVTLKNSAGETRTVKARNKKNLQNVEVGDQVVLTREKAVAASVHTPK